MSDWRSRTLVGVQASFDPIFSCRLVAWSLPTSVTRSAGIAFAGSFGPRPGIRPCPSVRGPIPSVIDLSIPRHRMVVCFEASFANLSAWLGTWLNPWLGSFRANAFAGTPPDDHRCLTISEGCPAAWERSRIEVPRLLDYPKSGGREMMVMKNSNPVALGRISDQGVCAVSLEETTR